MKGPEELNKMRQKLLRTNTSERTSSNLFKLFKLKLKMEEKYAEIKPLIRSILLALGRQATEKEFRSEYYNTEGESINSLLSAFKLSLWEFLRQMPDVCRIVQRGQETVVERVSTVESSHMDHLTIRKKPKAKPKYEFKMFSRAKLERFFPDSRSIIPESLACICELSIPTLQMVSKVHLKILKLPETLREHFAVRT